jgi:catechol 2,3-dioxygenase-like lactoylglutathione lyase family enzyme
MTFHHIALATKDLEATDRFYREAMGFDLVRVDVISTETGGWAKHAFYDTGSEGLLAFWDLHDDEIPDFDPAMSRAHGLPTWVNHLAFHVDDRADLDRRLKQWLEYGIDVVEIDHEWCVSIYATDPNGTMVEWCLTTREATDDDRAEARRVLADPSPRPGREPEITIHAATA